MCNFGVTRVRIIHVYLFCVHAVAQADDASEGMAAGKLREAAARGNLQEVLRLIEEGAKIQSDEVSILYVQSATCYTSVQSNLQ